MYYMRRVFIYILISLIFILPASASQITTEEDIPQKKSVFVYHIPDEEEIDEQKTQLDNTEKEVTDIISDDITADTTGVADIFEDSSYDMDDMYSAILQGYAQYNEEEETEGINLENYDQLSLNIKQPRYIGSKKYTSLHATPDLIDYKNLYSKYSGTEYSIAPISAKNSRSLQSPFGNFSAGTLFNQGIDTGELEQSSGVFSKYKYKRFSVTTSYLKTVNSTNNTYNDNFYIAPELELNQYFSLKEVFSADTVKRRKKAEIVLSVNPFGKKDFDRMRFELGASQTYDDENNLFKSQFKFSTNFKL